MNHMNVLVCYLTYGGNTQEVAELIQAHLMEQGHAVSMYRLESGPNPDLGAFDAIFLGTFTYLQGSTPEEMKDFVYDVGYKPSNVYIFGTGDTQFGGDELFCRAADRLAKFYESRFPPLKIEQSPRGSQEQLVREWTEGVLEQCLVY